MPRTLAVITVLFLAACGGGGGGGGSSAGGGGGGGGGGGVSSNGGQTSQYDGVRAVELTCFDGSFWGECVVTWEDGNQQKVCEWTIFGCQQVAKRKLGQVVGSVNYYNEFGNMTCLKLFENGWIEDCYNPSRWVLPTDENSTSSEGGSSSSAQSDSPAVGGERGTETTTTSTTTTTQAPPPPSLSLGSPRQDVEGYIHEQRLNGTDLAVLATLKFQLPISFANNSVESVCARPQDASTTVFLLNLSDFMDWSVLPQRSKNCTKLLSESETIVLVDVSEWFEIHVVLGTYPNGKQGFINECFGIGQGTCRTYDFELGVKSSKAGTSAKNIRISVHMDRRAQTWVLLTVL